MEFYEIKFATAPAWEADDFGYVPRKTCHECGLKAVPISSQYLVPEDTVSILSLETDEEELPLIFEAAGMLVAKTSIAEKLLAREITGFGIRSANITNREIEKVICDYVWLSIYGRCETTPVWHRVVSRCSSCHMEKTEPVHSSIRKVFIQSPLPTTDVFRGRERSAGIMVSAKFRDLILSCLQDKSQPEFKSILHA